MKQLDFWLDEDMHSNSHTGRYYVDANTMADCGFVPGDDCSMVLAADLLALKEDNAEMQDQIAALLAKLAAQGELLKAAAKAGKLPKTPETSYWRAYAGFPEDK